MMGKDHTGEVPPCGVGRLAPNNCVVAVAFYG